MFSPKMKQVLKFIILGIGFSVVAEYPDVALPCNQDACQLPSCRCTSTNIPGGFSARNIPQFVLLTFDDNVNIININTYREVTYNRKNKNGCPAAVTFFVNHEYTNYELVNELYNQGHEIALHSITHQTPQSYWAEATVDDMMREFADQRIQMSHFANIPYESMKGLRIPFLQMAGNSSFEMMAKVGLTYDLTWPTNNFINPGLWPYTLDYASTQDCVIPPCPTRSIPGPWVLPMISWFDLDGRTCVMVDACFSRPNLNDEEAWFKFIVSNFERHYYGNRAPFGFYVHEWFIGANPAVKAALSRFLDVLNKIHDVFMVGPTEVIDWVKEPKTVNEYAKQPCKHNLPTNCISRSCGPLKASHNGLNYYMRVCSVCPNVYPWLGNPLGK